VSAIVRATARLGLDGVLGLNRDRRRCCNCLGLWLDLAVIFSIFVYKLIKKHNYFRDLEFPFCDL